MNDEAEDREIDELIGEETRGRGVEGEAQREGDGPPPNSPPSEEKHTPSFLDILAGAGKDPFPLRQDPEKLKADFELLNVEHVFQPGQLVTPKPGMNIRRMPAQGEPAIVVRYLDKPFYNEEADQWMDIIIAINQRNDKGEIGFVEYSYSSNRLEPYKGGDTD